MPQLDLHSLMPQLVWFNCLFGIFCFIAIKVLIPFLTQKIKIASIYVQLRQLGLLPSVEFKTNHLNSIKFESVRTLLTSFDHFLGQSRKDF